jgi:hypothetical protein
MIPKYRIRSGDNSNLPGTPVVDKKVVIKRRFLCANEEKDRPSTPLAIHNLWFVWWGLEENECIWRGYG